MHLGVHNVQIERPCRAKTPGATKASAGAAREQRAAMRSNAQQRALTGTTTRVSPRINNLQSDASQLAQLCKLSTSRYY